MNRNIEYCCGQKVEAKAEVEDNEDCLFIVKPFYTYQEGTMDKIEDIISKRKTAHQKLLSLNSKVYKIFLDLEKEAYSDGALPRKHKELIAVGISVVTDCESCMQWHIDQAARKGASKEEILEVIEIGIEMGGGPATVSARFALEVMDKVFGAK